MTFLDKLYTARKAVAAAVVSALGVVGYFVAVPGSTPEDVGAAVLAVLNVLGVFFATNDN